MLATARNKTTHTALRVETRRTVLLIKPAKPSAGLLLVQGTGFEGLIRGLLGLTREWEAVPAGWGPPWMRLKRGAGREYMGRACQVCDVLVHLHLQAARRERSEQGGGLRCDDGHSSTHSD